MGLTLDEVPRMPSTLHPTKPQSTLLAEMREEAMSIILLQQVRETTLDISGGSH